MTITGGASERTALTDINVGIRRAAVLPLNDGAAAAARAVMRSVCAAWGVPHLRDVAVACASELAANAVKHARWPADRRRQTLWLYASVFGQYLLVEVHDQDDRLPVVGEGIDWDAFEAQGRDVDRLPVAGLGLFTVVERMRSLGGEFGSVLLPPKGKAVFFAVPMSRVPIARIGGS